MRTSLSHLPIPSRILLFVMLASLMLAGCSRMPLSPEATEAHPQNSAGTTAQTPDGTADSAAASAQTPAAASPGDRHDNSPDGISDDSCNSSPDSSTENDGSAATPATGGAAVNAVTEGVKRAPAPEADGGIVVKSGNALSSEEKRALLNELERELDALFAEIENVSDEEELEDETPEDDSQTDSLGNPVMFPELALIRMLATGQMLAIGQPLSIEASHHNRQLPATDQSFAAGQTHAAQALAATQTRPAGTYLHKLRASNQLTRRILSLKADILARQEPLLQQVGLRISDPQTISGDQLVALKDSLKTLQRLRVEARRLNAELLRQRLVFRERRLARDATGASQALDSLMQTQTRMVETLEGIQSVLTRTEKGL